MPKNKRIMLILIVVLAATGIALVTLRAQTQNNPAPRVSETEPSRDVVTDYTVPESNNLQERVLRQARSRRYDLNDPSVKNDIQKFTLKETDSPSLLDFPLSHAPVEPALPVAQSDAVVIGEITDAKAYLSSDKTNLYSEFTVRVKEVLSTKPIVLLNAGDAIAASRRGGSLRFPSGKIIRRGSLGKNSPQVGRSYLLFLKHNSESQDYTLITGYELREGRVFPLDGLPESEGSLRPFNAYASYKGKSEALLLSDVKTALLSSTQGTLSEERQQ